MLRDFTYRVYLPTEVVTKNNLTSDHLFVSDDVSGDERMHLLHKEYGNLTVECCDCRQADRLENAKPIWRGTIEDHCLGSGGVELDDNGNPIIEETQEPFNHATH